MNNDNTTLSGFESFNLDPALLRATNDLGYETPTSIQEQAIAPLLAGMDILGQAQTGTGKTAAFALPLLNNLDLNSRNLQVLVLTPTRELAIQVSEAFVQFAKHMKVVKVLPVYGGADMRNQLRALDRGVHIVVGTPGRVMDHLRRKSMILNNLTNIVLDEADEMLQMGFQEDVEWILEQAPENRQMSLFSATIPRSIHSIAKRFMNNPREITIQTETTTAPNIQQRVWFVSGLHKLDALSRILEAEDHDGVIVFVRTRAATVELAHDLEDRGFNVAPLNGDISQNMREQTIDRLKAGRINILVATDVAARGLDVDRISHVINYDAPHDAESYIHRVGRTGRAGRSGKAIIFLSKRQRGMLRTIERETRQRIDELELPKTKDINEKRIATFKQNIVNKLEHGDLDLFMRIVGELTVENDLDPMDIAAAAACMIQGDQPLLLSDNVRSFRSRRDSSYEDRTPSRQHRRSEGHRGESGRGESRRGERPRFESPKNDGRKGRSQRKDSSREFNNEYQMIKYRVDVGEVHGVKAGNLLGAIANEAGLEGKHIGKISIREDFSTVDLPVGMPAEILRELRKVWVSGQQLSIRLDTPPSKSRGKGKSSDSRKQRKRQRFHRGQF